MSTEAKSIQLRRVTLPDFGPCAYPGEPVAAEYERRWDRTRAAMRRQGWTHLFVYGDREHFANLLWLTGMDPRFEEAVLLFPLTGSPLLLTGVECEGYLTGSAAWQAGALRQERWDDFSLPDIERTHTREWQDTLHEEAIGPGTRVGVVGWKSYRKQDALDVPAYLVDELRATGATLKNGAGLFCDAATGLRAQSSAAEIARFEWANAEASDGMKAMIRGLRPGLTDHELARLLRYNGSPTGCHWTIKTGSNRTSLASPRGEVAARGGTLSANVCYRGANCCRAGWIAEEERELPEPARGYVPEFAGPYFAAMAGWFDRLRLGTKGDDIAAWIHAALPPDRFARKLNPGHLIHLEEWLSSPIATGSQVELASGMVLQSDVSPVSAHFFTVRMEDSYALAGPALREELAAEFPALWRRVGARRQFLREELGLALPEEVLPLSNLAGVVMPYLLDPERILTLA